MSHYRVRPRGRLLPEWIVEAPSAIAALDRLAQAMSRPLRELKTEFIAQGETVTTEAPARPNP